jgi:hypothetical protein
MTVRKKRGRPQFKPTAQQRRRVSISAAGGMAHQDIADAMGIARATLELHFAVELSVGALQRRQEMLEALHRTGKKGNVAAAKAFLALSPRVAPPPAPKPDKPLGKKEQASVDAQTAQQGSDWNELLTKPLSVQ